MLSTRQDFKKLFYFIYFFFFYSKSFHSISWDEFQPLEDGALYCYVFFGTHCLIYNIISHTLRQLHVRFFIFSCVCVFYWVTAISGF